MTITGPKTDKLFSGYVLIDVENHVDTESVMKKHYFECKLGYSSKICIEQILTNVQHAPLLDGS